MTVATVAVSSVKPLVWVVVVTKPGQERRAKRELEQQGFEIYLPMRLSINHRRETVAAPFFPRYLFAHVTLASAQWKAIWSTFGVQGLLGSVNRPYGVADRVIERVQAQEEEGYIKIGLEAAAGEFKPDQKVRLAGFDGLEAVFVERVDAKRALILVSFLGSESRARVDLSKLRAAVTD